MLPSELRIARSPTFVKSWVRVTRPTLLFAVLGCIALFTAFRAGHDTGAASVALPGRSSHIQGESWTIHDLGVLPGGTQSVATAINERGQIVGYSDVVDGSYHAVRWEPDGSITDLGMPPGLTDAVAEAINGLGQIAGRGWSPTLAGRAVRWDPDGTIVDLGVPANGGSTDARGINDLGQVVGVWNEPNPPRPNFPRAVRWDPDGTVSILGDLSGPRLGAIALGISNASHVVGVSGIAQGDEYGTLWDSDGSISRLLPLPHGYFYTYASAINQRRQVAGSTWTLSSSVRPQRTAVRWDAEGVPTNLGALPEATRSHAFGLNESDQIVGYSVDTIGITYSHAVLWNAAGGVTIIDLGTLPGGNASTARGINNHGQIVGESVEYVGAFATNRRAVLWHQ